MRGETGGMNQASPGTIVTPAVSRRRSEVPGGTIRTSDSEIVRIEARRSGGAEIGGAAVGGTEDPSLTLRAGGRGEYSAF